MTRTSPQTTKPGAPQTSFPTLGGLFTLLALLVMSGSVAYSISYAEWMPGLSVIMWAVVFGTLAGAALAFSSFPRWTAHLASLIYGLFCVGVIGGTRPDIVVLDDWRERVFLMLDKVTVWVREALNNGTSRETLIFFLILSSLFWVLSYTAAWYSFRRRRIWHVILPAGVTLFSNVYYYAGEKPMSMFLVVYLACAVVLLALSHLADREESWLRNRIRFNTSLRGGFVLTGLAIASVALLFSWRVTATMTSPEARAWFGRFNEPYNEVLARWNRLFSTLQNPVARPADSYQNAFELGGPRSLTEEPVMDVIAPIARYYWRAMSYDSYDGKTWRSTLQIEYDMPANANTLPLTAYQERVPVRADFSLQRGTDAIYSPSQPMQASVASRVVMDAVDDGTLSIAKMKLPVMLLPGNRFGAVGSLSKAKINQLRASGARYPEWTLRYLQVPAAVPTRVIDLAANVMRDQNNAFDKARATEAWLRQNIKYDEKLQEPPAGREGADYVLFETRRAYCNYYVTAMVMMLRSQGVPARMAVGYAQGDADVEEFDADVVTYHVKQRDSHAWVEVFFPDYGWVEFEPTAAQPEIPRLEDKPEEQVTPSPQPPTPTPLPTLTPLPGEMTPTPPPQAPTAPQIPSLGEILQSLWDQLRKSSLVYLLVLPVLAGLGWLALRVAETAGLSALPVIERTYAILTRWAGWLGIGREREHTPFEQAGELGKHAPEARQSVRRITELYVERRFGAPKDVSAEAAQRSGAEAREMWGQTRRRLGRAWLATRVRRLFKR